MQEGLSGQHLAELLLGLRSGPISRGQPAGVNPCDRLILTLELPPADAFATPLGRSAFMMALAAAARELRHVFPEDAHLEYETQLMQHDRWRHVVRIVYTDMTLEYEERRQRCRAATAAALLAGPGERGLRTWLAQRVWQTRAAEGWQVKQRHKSSVRRFTINL